MRVSILNRHASHTLQTGRNNTVQVLVARERGREREREGERVGTGTEQTSISVLLAGLL